MLENILKNIPKDPDNTDYQDYLKWVSEGGVVEAADQLINYQKEID